MLGIDFSHIKNQHDHKLCEEAYILHYTEWEEIDENLAETEEAREVLHNLKMLKFHQEEYNCGCL